MEKTLNSAKYLSLGLFIVIILNFITFFTPYLGSSLFDNINLLTQDYDTVAHSNFIKTIIDEIPKGFSKAFEAIFNLEGKTTNAAGVYPPLFHLFAGLIAIIFHTTVPAAIAITWFFGASVVFPIGMTYFVKIAFPEISYKFNYILTPIFSGCFALFPLYLMDWGALYAFGFAYAFLPFLLARAILVLQNPTKFSNWFFASIFGMTILLIQPRTLLTAAFLLVPVIIASFWHRGLNARIVLFAIFDFVFFGFTFYAATRFDLKSVLDPRFLNWQANLSIPRAVSNYITATPTFWPDIILELNPVFPILILFGLGILIKNRTKIWFIISYIMLGVLYILNSAINHPIASLLTTPWHRNEQRIFSALPFLAIPLCVLALSKLFQYIAKKNIAFLAQTFVVIILISTVALNGSMRQMQEHIHEKTKLSFPTENPLPLLDQEKYDFIINDLPKMRKGVKEILNNPYDGSALIRPLASMNVQFRTLDGEVSQKSVDEIKAWVGGDIASFCLLRPNITHFVSLGREALSVFPSQNRYRALTNKLLIPFLQMRNRITPVGDSNKFYKINCPSSQL